MLRNARAKIIRIAPLFDHGLSLLYSCTSDAMVKKFDVSEDKRCQNFIGSYSCYENLNLIENTKKIFAGKLKESDKELLLVDLQGILSETHLDAIWNMIYKRYQVYESL